MIVFRPTLIRSGYKRSTVTLKAKAVCSPTCIPSKRRYKAFFHEKKGMKRPTSATITFRKTLRKGTMRYICQRELEPLTGKRSVLLRSEEHTSELQSRFEL